MEKQEDSIKTAQDIQAEKIRDLEYFEAKYRGNSEIEFNEILSCIFKELPAVNVIFSYAETPSFNDGDPCTHYQFLAVQEYNLGEVTNIFGWLGDPVEDGSEPVVDPDDEISCYEKDYGVKFPRVNFWEVEKATPEQEQMIRAWDLLQNASHLFQDMWETNWEILIVRTGLDTFKVEHSYHDPGY